MDAAEVLERAADVIDERGHCRDGHYCDDSGAVCAIGAICIAANFSLEHNYCPRFSPAEMALQNALHGPGIPDWNDVSDAATVTSTMRAVAATLRAQANTEPYARNDKTAEQAEICG